MKKVWIFDVCFILIVFGMNMLRLNYNENIDQCGILCRHLWLPLVIAYYIGRHITKLTRIKEVS
jgi:hypothetical protein